MNRLRIGGAIVSAATMALVSYATAGIAASISAAAGAGGLIYITKELAGSVAEAAALKDDPGYLLWKLRCRTGNEVDEPL